MGMSAERQRLYRKRKREEKMVVKITVSREVREVLCEARWLGQWDEDDKKEVQALLQMMVDNMRPAVTRNS
jgi:hypothetical protein